MYNEGVTPPQGASPLAQTFQFPGTATAVRRPHRAKRPTGNKFQEIAFRSPDDMHALDVIADHILARLNRIDAEQKRQPTARLLTT